MGEIFYDKITNVADAVSTINNKNDNKSRGQRYWLHKGSQTATKMEILASFYHNKIPLYLVEKGITFQIHFNVQFCYLTTSKMILNCTT